MARILIVEDEAPIREICRRTLTADGFDVEVAADGKIAQAAIERVRFDLCVVDMRTPAMSGRELYAWLAERHPVLAGRLVFTTGDVMGADTERFLAQASARFLQKPFTPGELRDAVKEALRLAPS